VPFTARGANPPRKLRLTLPLGGDGLETASPATLDAGQAFADGGTCRGLGRADINGVINEFSSAENGVVTAKSKRCCPF
jgi:hypothetical protein